jgi:hypothetical protein
MGDHAVTNLRADVGGEQLVPAPDFEAEAGDNEGAVDEDEYAAEVAPYLKAVGVGVDEHRDENEDEEEERDVELQVELEGVWGGDNKVAKQRRRTAPEQEVERWRPDARPRSHPGHTCIGVWV